MGERESDELETVTVGVQKRHTEWRVVLQARFG